MSKVNYLKPEHNPDITPLEKDEGFMQTLIPLWQALNANPEDPAAHFEMLSCLKLGAIFWGGLRKDPAAMDDLELLAKIGSSWTDFIPDDDETNLSNEKKVANVLSFTPPNNGTIH